MTEGGPKPTWRRARDALQVWCLKHHVAGLDEVRADYLVDILERFEIDNELDLAKEIGEDNYFANVFAAMFEDWVTRPDDRGKTLVDRFLSRSLGRLGAGERKWLKAFRDATPSLYEVVAVVPDSHLDLRDMLGSDRAIVTVSERSGSSQLAPSDCITARLIDEGDRLTISGPILRFDFESARRLADQLTKQIAEEVDAFAANLGETPEAADRALLIELGLTQLGREIVQFWIEAEIQRRRAPTQSA